MRFSGFFRRYEREKRLNGPQTKDLILQFLAKTGFLTLSNYFCQLNITINLKSN
jgi:hypothetical protein